MIVDVMVYSSAAIGLGVGGYLLFSSENKENSRRGRKKTVRNTGKNRNDATISINKVINPVYRKILNCLRDNGAPCNGKGQPIDHFRYRIYRVIPVLGTKPESVRQSASSIALALGVSAENIQIGSVSNGYIPIRVAKKESEVNIVAFSQIERRPKNISIWFGIDDKNKPVTYDLSRLVHVMMAGTTGGGKSNALHVFVCSLLRYPPDRLRLIMIDPKHVTLSRYEGIDSLLCPIIKGVKEEPVAKAEIAMRWVAEEVDKRYEENNLNDYKIVVFIDELIRITEKSEKFLADLITVATLGRECGVHIIAAAQSPKKTNLDSELMENLPSRICVRVADHYVAGVMNCKGADDLFDRGDAILLGADNVRHRVQLPLITDGDIDRFLLSRKGNKPQYLIDLEPQKSETEKSSQGYDSLSAELKEKYLIALNAGVSGLLRIKSTCGVGDAKARKIQAALLKDQKIKC